MDTIHGKHLINGAWTATGQHTFAGYSPTTGSPLPHTYYEASPADVEAACEAAQAARYTYAQASGSQRAALLQAIAQGLQEQEAVLLELAHLETALALPRLKAELQRNRQQLHLYATMVAEGSWVQATLDTRTEAPVQKPHLASMQVPLGPVAVFGASNFPFAYSVAGGDTASALAAGCPVVVKAHPAHPGTSARVAAIVAAAVQQCGLPPGTFGMLQGAGHAVGAALVQHTAIQAVGFTGSLGGGRALYNLAAARPQPIPVYAEMGSVNPVFLLPGAVQAAAPATLEALALSITQSMGQFCTNPGTLVLLDQPESHTFLQALAQAVQAQPGSPMLTPAIGQHYTEATRLMMGTAGVQCLTAPAHPLPCPMLFSTTTATVHQQPWLVEEVFGPCSIAILATDAADMQAYAAQLPGQLTATLHATEADLPQAQALAALLVHKAGRLVWNGVPTGVTVSHAMVHGGPYPATTDSRSTAVGPQAIYRFSRPVCYQNYPDALLPAALQAANPLGIRRCINGTWGVH